MKRLVAYSILLGGLLLSCNLGSEERNSIWYQQWVHRYLMEIRLPTKDHPGLVIHGMDALNPATFCASSSQFCCVDSDGLSFAIPRQLTAEVGTWKYGADQYQVVDRDVRLRILESEVSGLLEIERIRPSDHPTRFQNRYLFSPSIGLIAVQFLDDGNQVLGTPFWLSGRVGLCAPSAA